jgi:type II secretory pathway pseudopilin PulG
MMHCLSQQGRRAPGGARSVRYGFTIVELLVVVGIIMVLVALLLPALQKARYQALEVVCSSNLRQISAALIGYASENKGWFPKNGVIRNDARSLASGTLFDVRTPLQHYMRAKTVPNASNTTNPLNVFLCPLTEPGMVNLNTTTSYVLLFDTRASNSTPNCAVGPGTNPLLQTDVNGQPLDYTKVGYTSWYRPNVDERKLLRKLGQKWTGKIFQTTQERTYRLLAGDYVNQRGHPINSRVTNHPERGEVWGRNGGYYQGLQTQYPRTTANYAATDGSVVKYIYSKDKTTGFSKIGEHADGAVGLVPDEFRVN